MSDEELVLARDALRARLEALVGEGPIPRFEEALTHPSFANETGGADNQRLEFLGDAVLGLCVSEMLVQSYVEADEGKLTRMRSALVNGEALAAWARHVDLGACVAFGRGAKLGSEREQTNVLADAAEALVAAVYESRGLEGARGMPSPTYRVVEVHGTPHDQVFEIEVMVGEFALARGEGRSKRQAERAAAMRALEAIGAEPITDA